MLSFVEIISILASSYPQYTPYVDKISPYLASSEVGITNATIIGFVVACVGSVLRSAAYRQLGANFTFHLAVRREHKLVTTGLYSFVRHPSYTAAYLYMLGTLIYQMGPGSYWAASNMWATPFGQAYGFA